jgi:hypothetical protein
MAESLKVHPGQGAGALSPSPAPASSSSVSGSTSSSISYTPAPTQTGTSSGNVAAKVVRRSKPLKLPAFPGAQNIKVYGTLAFVALLACLLWFGDGFFTLWFLQGWAAFVQQLLTFRWLIPWAITVGTLYTWPSRDKLRVLRATRRQWAEDGTEASMRKYLRARNQLVRHTVLFVILTLFNIGTSTQGLAEAAAGRYINLFGGFTLPASGTTSLRILSIVGGCIGAFGPEKLLRWVQDEYAEL